MFGNPQPIFFNNCFLAILLPEDRNFNGAELINKSSLNDCAFVASVQAAPGKRCLELHGLSNVEARRHPELRSPRRGH